MVNTYPAWLAGIHKKATRQGGMKGIDMSNDTWQEFKKSMPTTETRSMPKSSRGETPEDYLDTFSRLKENLKSKEN